MAHKVTFRIPGSVPYSHADIEVSGASAPDLYRELNDFNEQLMATIGRTLATMNTVASTTNAVGSIGEGLGGTVVPSPDSPPWPAEPAPYNGGGYEGQQPPVTAWQPNQPPAWQQQAPPAPPAWQQQAPPAQQWGQQAPQGPPPGVQAPICARHGKPASMKPAGISAKTKNPYNAFWKCDVGDNDCTRASNFPKIQ